ncbi:MAG: glycosyltransferase family 9 protein [Nonlabens sp.]|uniref:glycosyltransferase family 9 protein n=1 Tax=Nonlabens sp. TaxID=1888209 RepID=UPI003EF5C132
MTVPQRILVIRLSAMGDVAMCVPVLLALHRDYPSVAVITLSRKRFQPILSQIPNIQFVEAQVDDLHKGVPGLWKLAKELKEQQPQAIADFHNVLRSKMLRTFMMGIPTATIDKGRKEKKQLVENPSFFKPLKHTTERYADVLRKLGFEINLQHNEFLSKRPISAQIHEKIGKNTSKWIGFAPFAAHRTKAVGLEKAKEIAQEIAGLSHVKLLLFGGGKKETSDLAQIASTADNMISFAGNLDFEEELNLISNLDAMVAMDSGNGHLAAMYGVPVITLWGNTHLYAGFAPYAQPIERQLTVSRTTYPLVPTSIFGNQLVDGYEDITDSIETTRVIEELNKLL